MLGKKICIDCEREKDISCFSKNRCSFRAECKECNSGRYALYDRRYTWERQGIKFPSLEYFLEIYDLYINTSNCSFCNSPFKNRRDRCLERINYAIYDTIRGIACRNCKNKLIEIDRSRSTMLHQLKNKIITK